MSNVGYTVVENAGYEGECDICTFPTLSHAISWVRNQYEEDEREELHVQVRKDFPDGEGTYEF
jgi:hypothetical protein